MAVYYKWIKGCQPGSKLTSTTSKSDAGLWTYLTWGSSNSSGTPTETDDISSNRNICVMPKLKARIGKDDSLSSGTQDLGYFLTTKMPAPLIQTDLRTNKTLYFIDTNYVTENESFTSQNLTHTWMQHSGNVFTIQGCNGKDGDNKTTVSSIVLNSDQLLINKNGDNQLIKVAGYDNRFSETGGAVNIDGNVLITDTQGTNSSYSLCVNGGVILGGLLPMSAYFPKASSSESIQFFKELNIDGHPCHAQYFNATSDKRAKENIKPATYNAVELVKKLPVYIYNYKNKTETVTGILAQDLLQAQPEGLDLVSNIGATGENGDYMSIKNDKLMFVLMKAIQEQQAQIEELKTELENLKKSL